MRRKIRIAGRRISDLRSPELKSDRVNSSSHVIFKVLWVGSGDVFTWGIVSVCSFKCSESFSFPFLAWELKLSFSKLKGISMA